jgi:hypothetical protein
VVGACAPTARLVSGGPCRRMRTCRRALACQPLRPGPRADDPQAGDGTAHVHRALGHARRTHRRTTSAPWA